MKRKLDKSTPLSAVPMSVRAANTLSPLIVKDDAGDLRAVKTVGDLVWVPLEKLAQVRNCGSKTLAEIAEIMRRGGVLK